MYSSREPPLRQTITRTKPASCCKNSNAPHHPRPDSTLMRGSVSAVGCMPLSGGAARRRTYREAGVLASLFATVSRNCGGTLSDQPSNRFTILPSPETTKICGTAFFFDDQVSMASRDNQPSLKLIFVPPAKPLIHSASVVELRIVRPTTSTPRPAKSWLNNTSYFPSHLDEGQPEQ